MSSPDDHPSWGTPQPPAGAPAPPPMTSPYGVPLNGGPEEPGGPQGGGHGPGSGGPADAGRRRKTLITSALAVVAVVGIGGAVASMHGSPKHDSASPAGVGSSEAGATSTGNGSAVLGLGGKPDGDAMVAASTNGAQGANVPEDPTGSTTGGQSKQSTSAPGGSPATSSPPAGPATSAPAAPATSAPVVPKPSTPAGTTKPPAAKPPSSDCTYLDLPASQMPTIKEGSGNANAVKQLQCLLKKSELGIKPLAIDGQWGPATQSAMTAFQSCNNSPTVHSPGGTPPYPKLAVDGVAGPQTWADLYFWDNQYFNGTAYYCNGTR